MPISFEIHRDLRLFVTRYSGIVTDAEFRSTYARIRPAHPEWRDLDEIADMRAMTHFAVAHRVLQEEAERTASFLARHDLQVRCGVIAPEDLPFALSRVYGAHADFAGHEEVQVFRDADSATDWLGVPSRARSALFSPEANADPPASAPVRQPRDGLFRALRSSLGQTSKG